MVIGKSHQSCSTTQSSSDHLQESLGEVHFRWSRMWPKGSRVWRSHPSAAKILAWRSRRPPSWRWSRRICSAARRTKRTSSVPIVSTRVVSEWIYDAMNSFRVVCRLDSIWPELPNRSFIQSQVVLPFPTSQRRQSLRTKSSKSFGKACQE